MRTPYHLLIIISIVSILGFKKPDSNNFIIKQPKTQELNWRITSNQIPESPNKQISHQLIYIAKSQVGVREATGNNDGPQVEQYLAYTGNKKGEPWCAAFVSWVFGQVGLRQPRSAWSPALFPPHHLVKAAKPATVFGIYFPEKGRIAHVGLVEKQRKNWVYTIEGNTNVAGSREGDGVYQKLRHVKTISCYADWTSKKGVAK